MRSIRNKQRSQLSGSNVMNGLLLSITNFTPDITDLLKAKQYQVSLKLVMFLYPVRENIFILNCNSVRMLFVPLEVTN